VPEILGEMLESCAPSGCRACSVRSPCTCESRTVGILEIAGIQAPIDYIFFFFLGFRILPKDGEKALWPSTNGAIPYFLVLPGSEFSITEITEYTYFSP